MSRINSENSPVHRLLKQQHTAGQEINAAKCTFGLLCTKRAVIPTQVTKQGRTFTQIKADGLHFNLTVIVSFSAPCARPTIEL